MSYLNLKVIWVAWSLSNFLYIISQQIPDWFVLFILQVVLKTCKFFKLSDFRYLWEDREILVEAINFGQLKPQEEMNGTLPL